MYDILTNAWTFYFYPLEAPASQNGGWVGLSDIHSLGDGKFLVLERDNQGGPDAAIKIISLIDLSGLADGDTVTKTVISDILPNLSTAIGGLTIEKVEGLTMSNVGDVWISTDNDGVDDNSGETQVSPTFTMPATKRYGYCKLSKSFDLDALCSFVDKAH